jgi:DNA invertase Pin-like site-specific DNA recombinase
MNKDREIRKLNCAIYTRKSTEEGLDQDFNTLDAQRESAESYIKSQEAEGWVCLPDHYDDGGFTGGNKQLNWFARNRREIGYAGTPNG